MNKILTLLLLCFGLLTAYAAPASMQETKVSFASAVTQVAPAVVNIFTEKRAQRRAVHPLFNDPFFNKFFNMPAPVRERVERSLGSGVIVTPDGYMITNQHVIDEATEIKVIFHDRREKLAKVINVEPSIDLAILKLQLDPGESVPYATFGDSDELVVGDVALAIGNPFGVGQSVSMGIISAVGRATRGLEHFGGFIQTDAAINPGNSGGALIDSLGHVVGMNTAIFSQTGASHGIGFATPANLIKPILESVIATGKIVKPWLGATGQDVTGPIAEKFGFDAPTGVLVNEVVPDGPADKAGIRVGDVILLLGGKEVTDTRSLQNRMLSTPGVLTRRIEVTVWRDGRMWDLYLKFEAIPQREDQDQVQLSGRHPLDGFTVENLSPALNQELEIPLMHRGVAVVQAGPQKGLLTLDLRPGDLLVEINGRKIKNIDDVQKALADDRRGWKIQFQRGNQVFNVIIN